MRIKESTKETAQFMASSGIPVKSGHVHLPAPNIVRPQTGPRSLVPLLPALLMFYAALLPQEVRLSIAGQVILSLIHI